MSSVDQRKSTPSAPVETAARRSFLRQLMQWVRRLHLYLGLFLFPWAVLYGFTGFLFNHPQVMSDQPIESFGTEAWVGTPMASLPALESTADEVVRALKLHHSSASPDLKRVENQPARYASDFAFATVKTAEGEIGLLIDPRGNGGTIRRVPSAQSAPAEEPFPWAIGPTPAAPPAVAAPNSNDRLARLDTLADRLKASIPEMLRTQGLPSGEITVTSVPDLTFAVESSGQRWKVHYNALKNTVGGKPLDATPQPLTWRRFLIRMHLTHGYPFSSTSTKWFWAIGVDAIAIVMIYWGGSGLLMWWQIKSTRRWGLAILLLSALAATLLAVGMHEVISAR